MISNIIKPLRYYQIQSIDVLLKTILNDIHIKRAAYIVQTETNEMTSVTKLQLLKSEILVIAHSQTYNVNI